MVPTDEPAGVRSSNPCPLLEEHGIIRPLTDYGHRLRTALASSSNMSPLNEIKSGKAEARRVQGLHAVQANQGHDRLYAAMPTSA
jgi:hypothetical protein